MGVNTKLTMNFLYSHSPSKLKNYKMTKAPGKMAYNGGVTDSVITCDLQ